MSDRATPRFVSLETLRDSELAALQRVLPEEQDGDDFGWGYDIDGPKAIRRCEGRNCREVRAPLMRIGEGEEAIVLCEQCFEEEIDPDFTEFVYLIDDSDDC